MGLGEMGLGEMGGHRTPTLRATMHTVVLQSGVTNGQTEDMMMTIADHTVNLKITV